MNAVDRFWRARSEGDWESLAAQLRPRLRVSLPAQASDPGRDDYLAFLRLVHQSGRVESVRSIAGRSAEIAVIAQLVGPGGDLVVAGFYELREGLIELIEEIYVKPGSAGDIGSGMVRLRA